MLFAHCVVFSSICSTGSKLWSLQTCLKMVPIWLQFDFNCMDTYFTCFAAIRNENINQCLVSSTHFSAQVIYSRKLDITTCFGFLVLLYQARRLLAHGCAWYAVPCGSWIYLSFSKTWKCFPPDWSNFPRTVQTAGPTAKPERKSSLPILIVKGIIDHWCVRNLTPMFWGMLEPLSE